MLLIVFFCSILSHTASAGPGDTTWVTVYNLRTLDHYGSFDTTAIYPSLKKYRKIRMHYILGVYNCPGSPQYCSDWDYTTQVIARPKNMDTVEIGRVITPYAGDWLGKNISHDYVMDVTDYAPALHDTVGMRFKYEGYSWGFNLTLKLEFIEGTPPMDVVNIKNIYNGYYPYGNTSNPIENYLTSKTFSYSSASNVLRAYIRNTVSGHGSDNSGCSEFCNRYYNLKIDNNQVAQRQLWRNDCGRNPVSPQPGTWIYERGNWCPGAIVNPIFHDISMLTLQDTPFDVDIDMQGHSGNGSAGYNFVTQLFTFSGENYVNDISIEEIIAPRKDPHYFSNNSACMNPVIRIKNTGYDSVHTIVFEYGIRGRVPITYTWTGSIGFLQEQTITFPSSMAFMSQPTTQNFDVKITSVNQMPGDDYADNNFYTSKTNTLLTLPREFVIRTTTNGSNKPATLVNQTRWLLINDIGDTIADRLSMASNSSFRDSVFNLADGCYKMIIEDSGCDGYSWWANQGAGNGSMSIHLPKDETPLHLFNGDFGCGSATYFYIGNRPPLPPLLPPPVDNTGLKENSGSVLMTLYPNPANTALSVRIAGSVKGEIVITDVTGRQLLTKEFESRNGSAENISTTGLASGVYFLKLNSEGKNISTKKFLIQH